MKDRSPLVSIILPVYNAEKTIDRAITSVLSQSYSNFELIIINDGSLDNTLEVCKKYIDARICIESQRNKGLSNARNKGISLSRGVYICFIDADDWYEMDYLHKMIENINATKTDFVVCDFIPHLKDNVCIRPKINNTVYTKLFDNKDFLQLFESGIMNPVWNKLYKKRIIDIWNLRFENIAIVEDLPFNLNYIKHIHSVSFIKDGLYHYDISTSVLTKRISEEMFQNYISVHAFFLSLVNIEFHNIISRSIYHQYLSLTIRYINQIKIGKLQRREAFTVLNKYLDNLLIRYSIQSYYPKGYKDIIIYSLIRFHCYSILFFLLKRINRE